MKSSFKRRTAAKPMEGERPWLAFTVVELLVSLGVLSLLMAVLLPVVQRSRETARRTQCLSNLRQLGMACHEYVTVKGRFPDYRPPGTSIYGHWVSGHVNLLPYLDRSELLQQIDPHESVRPGAEPPKVAINSSLLDVALSVFVCPSDSVPVGGVSYRACLGTSPGIHTTHRPGQPVAVGAPAALRGVLVRGLTPAKVRDGLSQTALYSERVVGDMNPKVLTAWRDVVNDQSQPFVFTDQEAEQRCRTLRSAAHQYSGAGRAWIAGHYHHSAYNHILTPNSDIPDCAYISWSNFNGTMTARSMHAGGVNLALADGAVRFISDGIDMKVWRALATVDGAEVVSGNSR